MVVRGQINVEIESVMELWSPRLSSTVELLQQTEIFISSSSVLCSPPPTSLTFIDIQQQCEVLLTFEKKSHDDDMTMSHLSYDYTPMTSSMLTLLMGVMLCGILLTTAVLLLSVFSLL